MCTYGYLNTNITTLYCENWYYYEYVPEQHDNNYCDSDGDGNGDSDGDGDGVVVVVDDDDDESITTSYSLLWLTWTVS